MVNVAPPPPEGWVASLLTWIKTLTLTNVLVIALLTMIAVPAYLFYKALNDAAIMDRLMSQYREVASPTSCTVREAKERGGPDLWAISTGFAFQGNDRWVVSVVLPKEPTPAEVESFCQAAKLIVDSMYAPP